MKKFTLVERDVTVFKVLWLLFLACAVVIGVVVICAALGDWVISFLHEAECRQLGFDGATVLYYTGKPEIYCRREVFELLRGLRE